MDSASPLNPSKKIDGTTSAVAEKTAPALPAPSPAPDGIREKQIPSIARGVDLLPAMEWQVRTGALPGRAA